MAARLVTLNRWLTATLSASSAVTDRPLSYLGLSARWQFWRSAADGADAWVKADLGAAVSIDTIALVDAVIHAGGSVKVQSSTDNATWTDRGTFTVPTDDVTGVWPIVLSPAVSARYWRIYWTNTGTVSTAVEAAVVVIGAALVPGCSVALGVSMGRSDLSVLARSTQGQPWATTLPQLTTIAGTFATRTSVDQKALLAAYRAVGTHTPWLFCLDATDADQCWYGRFANALPITHRVPSASLWSVPFTFTEDVGGI